LVNLAWVQRVEAMVRLWAGFLGWEAVKLEVVVAAEPLVVVA